MTDQAVLDVQNANILACRAALFAAHTTPQEGDFVQFPGGITRRISYVWEGCEGPTVQTSDSGSWYLGQCFRNGVETGYMSFSGALYSGIPIDALMLTDAQRDGSCWFFSHDYRKAHNGVEVCVPCRIWQTDLPAPGC